MREVERHRVIVDHHDRDAAQRRIAAARRRSFGDLALRTLQREPDFERRAAAGAPAQRRDGAAVQLDEVAHDTQAETQAAVCRVVLLSP